MRLDKFFSDSRDHAAAWALALGGALFYLGCPSYRFNFDGVACAIAVELGDWRHLAHGNHVLFGVLGRLFFDAWTRLGYHGRALPALCALDAILGGAGLAVFFQILRSLGLAFAESLIASLGLGVSAAYWIWSLEAQVYPLGVLFLLLTFRELVKERPRPFRAALWHALAVLGHAGHVLFLPAGLWLASRSSVGKRGAGAYALSLGALLVAGYAAAALFLIHPRSWPDLRIWLLGSAALKVGGEFHWHFAPGASSLSDWLLAVPRLFADPLDPSRPPEWGWALGFLGAALAALGAWRLARDAPARPWAGAVFLWLGAYACLYLSWEPSTLVYRISDLPPLWVLVVFGARALSRRAQPLLAALSLGLGLYNGRYLIAPFETPSANASYAQALRLAKRTPPDAWIITSGIGSVYIPYFARRKTINRRYYEGRADALAERIASLLAKGEPVYWDSGTAAVVRHTPENPRGSGRKN